MSTQKIPTGIRLGPYFTLSLIQQGSTNTHTAGSAPRDSCTRSSAETQSELWPTTEPGSWVGTLGVNSREDLHNNATPIPKFGPHYSNIVLKVLLTKVGAFNTPLLYMRNSSNCRPFVREVYECNTNPPYSCADPMKGSAKMKDAAD